MSHDCVVTTVVFDGLRILHIYVFDKLSILRYKKKVLSMLFLRVVFRCLLFSTVMNDLVVSVWFLWYFSEQFISSIVEVKSCSCPDVMLHLITPS